MLARSVGNFRAFDSFRSALEEPGEDNGNGKAKDDEKNNRADRPVRNIENRKYLRNALRKRPAGDRVRDRDLVNVASLQLGEQVHVICRSPYLIRIRSLSRRAAGIRQANLSRANTPGDRSA